VVVTADLDDPRLVATAKAAEHSITVVERGRIRRRALPIQ
jgi:hypothetical protein